MMLFIGGFLISGFIGALVGIGRGHEPSDFWFDVGVGVFSFLGLCVIGFIILIIVK